MPAAIFQGRITHFEQQFARHSDLATRYSLLRAIAFLAGAVCFVLFLNKDHWMFVPLLFMALVGFIFFVTRYQFHEGKKAFFTQLILINREEIDRLNLHLSGFRTGDEYAQKDHPYQADLDVLGQHSLFQLLNRSALPDAEKMLVQWLSEPAEARTITRRQEAIRELSQKVDWFQHFRAAARVAVNQKSKEAPHTNASHLNHWASKQLMLRQSLWKMASIILVVLSLALGACILLQWLPYQVIYISIVLNGGLLALVIKKLNHQIAGIDKAHYMVSTYSHMISEMEKQTFVSEELCRLQSQLTTPNSASLAIKKLSNLTLRISARGNMFYMIADFLLILDAFLLLDILKWKKTNADHMNKWLEAVHQLECLISMAAFTHANPQYVFPEVTLAKQSLKASDMGHPLVSAAEMVTNDYEISGSGSVDIITGSNMSGKSTFQRTLGINMVLAGAGAPVFASAFTFTPCRIFTSMRTKDNLEEHTSSFYAELKRIAQLLDLTKRGEVVFFLLDEILKGTNSQDRHTGAVALVKKLTKTEAFGLISTHDLSLGQLEETELKVKNYSFNSSIEGDRIIFDYHLSKGVCRSFNASQLMRNMGIID